MCKYVDGQRAGTDKSAGGYTQSQMIWQWWELPACWEGINSLLACTADIPVGQNGQHVALIPVDPPASSRRQPKAAVAHKHSIIWYF